MVDNNEEKQDVNDEYQYSEIDQMGSENATFDNETSPLAENKNAMSGVLNKPVWMKAIVVLAGFFMILLVYKFLSSVSTSNSPAIPAVIPTAVVPQIPAAPQPISAELPKSSVQPAQLPTEVTQKLSVLEVTQQNLSTDMNNLNSQVTTLSSNVSDINNKIDQLNQTVSSLASQIAEQSQQIAILTAHAKSHQVRTHQVMHRSKQTSGRVVYYIQAVIPGRAWLISSTGNTMTVRDGSSVPGYGVVKLIEPSEGRIITTSGRVIKFSQLDS